MTDISNRFNLTITAMSQMAAVAAQTAPGTFSQPLLIEGMTTLEPRDDPENATGTDYLDCAGDTVVHGYNLTRAWIWLSQFHFYEDGRKIIGLYSPHPDPGLGGMTNSFLTMLTVIDELSSVAVAMENPFGGTPGDPKPISHGFDNMCIFEDRVYKQTSPYNPGGGYLSPAIEVIDATKLTIDRASGQNGAAYLGNIGTPLDPDSGQPNLTAPALFALPGPRRLIMFHKKRIYPVDLTQTPPVHMTPITISQIVPPAGQPHAFHNLGHFHPVLGKGVFGGGAYNPVGTDNTFNLKFFTVSNNAAMTITQLDDAPVPMSVSETNLEGNVEAKCCFTWDPLSTESLSFHDDLVIRAVNPLRPAGQQWRTVATIPAAVGEVDWVCASAIHGGIWTGHSRTPGGLAHMRFYKPLPPPAADTTAPLAVTLAPISVLSSSSLKLDWNASSDPTVAGQITSGMKEYLVRRNGAVIATVQHPTVTYTDTGLAAGTSYGYTVQARDVAQNVSAQSPSRTGTTLNPVVSVWPIQAGNGLLSLIPGQTGYAMFGFAGTGRDGSVAGASGNTGAGITFRYVTNTSTSASTTGSFPQVAAAHNSGSGDSAIIFNVSGAINMGGNNVVFTRGGVYICGATAPSPGFNVHNGEIQLRGPGMICTDMRVRHGSQPGTALDQRETFMFNGGSNIVLFRSSGAWSTDELVEAWTGWDNVDILRCVFTEPLFNVNHPNGGTGHNYGPLFGHAPAGVSGKVSFNQSAIAHTAARGPMWFCKQMYHSNNLVYNFRGGFRPVKNNDPQTINLGVCRRNYYLNGVDSTGTGAIDKAVVIESALLDGSKFWLEGNRAPTGTIPADQWGYNNGLIGYRQGTSSASSSQAAAMRARFESPDDPTTFGEFVAVAADETFRVNAAASFGARPLDRDAVDTRWAAQVLAASGSWVGLETDVGGFPVLAQNTIDHTLAGAHGGDPLITDSTRNTAQVSGYAKWEEWYHRRLRELGPV